MFTAEELKGAVLSEALTMRNDSTLKAVRAWSNLNKLSSALLRCLPGPDGLSNQAFLEAMAIMVCMPSPVCRDRIGCLGGHEEDIFGDSIMSEILPGDHWRIRHDKVKMAVHSLCNLLVLYSVH